MVDKLDLEEVKSAFNKDKTRLGDVWRLSKEGLEPDQIAEKLGVAASAFVYGYRFYIKVIVEGVLPESRTTAEGCASALRGFAKRHRESFSHATDSELQKRAKECDRIADAAKREGQTDEPSAKKDESADWRDDLLDTLQNMPPDAFERLCQTLLRESGFIEVEVTGKSGDGGIDGYGIIRLAGMISFPVLFQCKRYIGNVGSNVVRDFRGAMAGRAEKGIILTTGGFTRDAQREAMRDGAAPVDLIDGQLLTDKMKSLKLGVHTKTVEVVQVDKHWFESFFKVSCSLCLLDDCWLPVAAVAERQTQPTMPHSPSQTRKDYMTALCDKIKSYLDRDQSNIGKVWRLHVNGSMNKEQVANELGVTRVTIDRHKRTIKVITGEQRGLEGSRLWKDVDTFIQKNRVPNDLAEQIRERRNIDDQAQLSLERSTDSDLEARTLLAKLVPMFGPHQTENIAVETLGHILSESDAARCALLDVLRTDGEEIGEIAWVKTQASGEEGTRPDLAGFDQDDKERVLIEAKFWAELTDNQPIAYLERLPQNQASVLLFVAPTARLHTLWAELSREVSEAPSDIKLGPDRNEEEGLRSATAGDKRRLVLVSWTVLLDRMASQASTAGESHTEYDIRQLRGLAAQMDERSLPPTTAGRTQPGIPAPAKKYSEARRRCYRVPEREKNWRRVLRSGGSPTIRWSTGGFFYFPE